MVQVNWLSVHRASPYERVPEEMRHATAIDQKLTDLNNSLVRYFSKLATNYAEKAAEFQKTSFLSLVSIQKEADVNSFVKSIDLAEEKRSLASIFELLGVAPKHYSKHVDQVAEDFESARELFLSNSPMHLPQLFAIATSFRTHSIVQLYEKLQEERKMIYSPVNKFVEVVNGLLAPRKKVSISSQNELVVMGTGNGKRIEIEALSSGEKQLLIILGQALLQESTPVVFIADEPELSLHVEWQEKLTPSIAELNPNAQIVFATHSPDIVGAYTHRTIDMESVAS
jgi:phosphotransferase system HPr-like phosphotransfer protein